MAVYQNKKNKKWICEIWFGSQKLQTKTFSIKALATQFEREELQRLERNKVCGIQASDHSYETLFDFWLKDAQLRKRNTSLVKDVQMYAQYIAPIIGALKTSEISIHHFQQISVRMTEEQLEKSTINKVIQHYKAVFNYAYKHDLILRNPAKNVKQFRINEKEMEFLSREEVEQFLKYSSSKYVGESRWKHVFYLCLFTTGLRLGEALAISYDKIRWDTDFLVIEQMWDGKTNQIISTTKGKKERLVPISSELKRELGAIRNFSKGEFVFSELGTIPTDPNNLRKRMWGKDLKAAEVRRIRLHDARHTYASLFMMNGGSLYDLKKILGHASITTTEKYSHLSPNHLAGLKDIIKLNLTSGADVITLQDLKKSPSIPLQGFSDAQKVV